MRICPKCKLPFKFPTVRDGGKVEWRCGCSRRPSSYYTVNIFMGQDHWQPSQGRFDYAIGAPERKEREMLELTCTNYQRIKVTVNPNTGPEGGNVPAPLDGPITVEVQSGEGTFTLESENSFYVVSGDNPGDTAYLVSGDADVGEGVETISDIVLLHVQGAKAQSLGLVADPPEAK